MKKNTSGNITELLVNFKNRHLQQNMWAEPGCELDGNEGEVEVRVKTLLMGWCRTVWLVPSLLTAGADKFCYSWQTDEHQLFCFLGRRFNFCAFILSHVEKIQHKDVQDQGCTHSWSNAEIVNRTTVAVLKQVTAGRTSAEDGGTWEHGGVAAHCRSKETPGGDPSAATGRGLSRCLEPIGCSLC